MSNTGRVPMPSELRRRVWAREPSQRAARPDDVVDACGCDHGVPCKLHPNDRLRLLESTLAALKADTQRLSESIAALQASVGLVVAQPEEASVSVLLVGWRLRGDGVRERASKNWTVRLRQGEVYYARDVFYDEVCPGAWLIVQADSRQRMIPGLLSSVRVGDQCCELPTTSVNGYAAYKGPRCVIPWPIRRGQLLQFTLERP
jgi:hypothetical protein